MYSYYILPCLLIGFTEQNFLRINFSMDIYVYCLTAQTNTLKDKQRKKENKNILFLVICLHFMGLILLLLLLLLLTLLVCSLALSYGAHSFFFIVVHSIRILQKQNTFFFFFFFLCQYHKLFAIYSKASSKGGKWLRCFQNGITPPTVKPYPKLQ